MLCALLNMQTYVYVSLYMCLYIYMQVHFKD